MALQFIHPRIQATKKDSSYRDLIVAMSIITYLLRPRETVSFVAPRPPLLPEAKPRATTSGRGATKLTASRGLSK